ncbi:uncharacterized protein V6R79_019425 [Siganus canaliculatus]
MEVQFSPASLPRSNKISRGAILISVKSQATRPIYTVYTMVCAQDKRILFDMRDDRLLRTQTRWPPTASRDNSSHTCYFLKK